MVGLPADEKRSGEDSRACPVRGTFIALIPLHERLLPGDVSWTTLAAVAIFALGFVGVLSAAFDQQSGSSTFRSAGFGVILIIVGDIWPLPTRGHGVPCL